MERTICYQGESIAYQLEWKRVKNVNIRVLPSGLVCVSANRKVASKEVDRIVSSRAEWIVRARTYYAGRAVQQMPVTYQSGEPVHLFGKRYELQVERSNLERIVPEGNDLRMFVRNPEDFSHNKHVFEAWYRAGCEAALTRAVETVFPLFQEYQIPMPQFRIRKMKTRWGSCLPTKRMVTINLYLAQAPIICMEYVVAHELAHLVRADHSAQFYAVLDAVMPDHKERKRLLREQRINCYTE